jgi:hypothetical protein
MTDNINQQCRQLIFIEMAARDNVYDLWLRRRSSAHRPSVLLENFANLITSIVVNLPLTPEGNHWLHEIYDIGLLAEDVDAGRIELIDVILRIQELSGQIHARSQITHDKTIELLNLVLEIGTKDLINIAADLEAQKYEEKYRPT